MPDGRTSFTHTSRSETEWQRRKRRERERAEHVAEHGPGCQICGSVPKRGGLHQDHDHKTNVTRGYLCWRCNNALPSWVTPEWLEAAARYLRRDGQMGTLDSGAAGAAKTTGRDLP